MSKHSAALSRVASREKRKPKPPLFVLSVDRRLTVRQRLLDTLALDRDLLRRSARNGDLAKFLREAERSWAGVRGDVERGTLNPILWLRSMLREAYRMGLWIPPAFVRRLRELERGDLLLEGPAGPVQLPRHAGMPAPFAQACELMLWKFPYIVPGLREGEFEDCREQGGDHTRFVQAVCGAWESLAAGADPGHAREIIASKMKEAGWTVTAG